MAMSTIEKLYQHYRTSIFRYLYRMGGDYHLADELTQETFCRAFVSLKGFRGESTLSTWLFGIAYYVYTGYLRGRPVERNLPLKHDIPDVNNTNDPAHSAPSFIYTGSGRSFAFVRYDQNRLLAFIEQVPARCAFCKMMFNHLQRSITGHTVCV